LKPRAAYWGNGCRDLQQAAAVVGEKKVQEARAYLGIGHQQQLLTDGYSSSSRLAAVHPARGWIPLGGEVAGFARIGTDVPAVTMLTFGAWFSCTSWQQ